MLTWAQHWAHVISRKLSTSCPLFRHDLIILPIFGEENNSSLLGKKKRYIFSYIVVKETADTNETSPKRVQDLLSADPVAVQKNGSKFGKFNIAKSRLAPSCCDFVLPSLTVRAFPRQRMLRDSSDAFMRDISCVALNGLINYI